MTTQHKSQPLVSVIMPVYNAEKFLKESIDSILRQTYENFEFIIINDGSKDGSQAIIDYYKSIDTRIVALAQENKGVVATANRGIEVSNGKYIARMDADDVSLPERLEQEVAILEKHEKTVLVCSSFEIFDEGGEFLYKDIVAPRNREIKRAMYLRNPIANGSTLIRKEALVRVGGFDNIFAEDFHMWMKLDEYGDFEATGTVLYRWRMNSKGLTLSNNDLSMSKSEEFISELWNNRFPAIVSRAEIKDIQNSYKNIDTPGGTFVKIALTDISQLASKLFISGHYAKGLHQLTTLAFSGKKGLYTALQRIHFVAHGHYSKVLRKIPFGRTAYDDTVV